MNRIKSNYHTLQVFKTARPKLRKAIISNCNSDLVNSVSRVQIERVKREYKAKRLYQT
jgi:hypothetical protein